jgi:hypothetical protein
MLQAHDDFEIVWEPIPDTSQESAMMADAHHILLAGGRGWGKTELQLMRFRMRVGLGYGSYWRGVIFDREYKNLDDLVTKSKRLFRLFDDGAQWLASNSDYKWRWPTGEELLFRQAKTLDDYWSYHGHEYSFLGWNELTKYANRNLYQKMMSINRTGFDPVKHTPRRAGHNGGPPLEDDSGEAPYDTPDGLPLPPIPLEVCSTTNPYGPGHNWVKRDFIDVAPYGVESVKEFEVFNPKTKREETIRRTQIALFGSFRENPYLSPEYIAGLYEETDENIIKAWVHGDWDIVAGGALDDKWRRHVHVIPRFKVPEDWYIDRAFDWGSSHPFSVGWFVEANGEEIKLENGLTLCPARGTIIQIAEWYGTKGIGTNAGLKLSAKDVADGIKEREIELIKGGWISKQPSPGPADNQIKNVTERETDTIAKKMADRGIRWEDSDKAKGTRKQGLQLMRDRLEASLTGEGPGLLFTSNCTASISTIPVLPRDDKDPDDVDTDAEDHVYDMVRYRLLKGNNRTAKVIHVTFPR